MSRPFEAFPVDRFDQCAERHESGERCYNEADHGGLHSFEEPCERCGGSGLDPSGPSPGAACLFCAGTGAADPPDPL